MSTGRFLPRRTVRSRRRAVLIPAVVAALAVAGFPGNALAAQGGGGGGGETTATNNLSSPTIWSDGVGVTVPGTFGTEQWGGATFEATDGTTVYQNGDPLNQWQAENVFGVTGTPVNVTQIDWGDNLESRSLPTGKPIRVEVGLLEDNLPVAMTGYTMLSNGLTQLDEKFGTTAELKTTTTTAHVYSACARLTVQRLAISRTDPAVSRLVWDPAAHAWTGAGLIASPIVNEDFAAEINASGNAIYGYNWTSTDTAGDYRVTFSLNASCAAAPLNTFLTSATGIYVTPTAESAVARPAAEPTGSTAQVDSADNLSYVDVQIGTPAYTPYVAPPTNTELPQVSGSPIEGQSLSSSQGTWADNPTAFGYQWQSCDGSGANCTNIAGATEGSYTLTSNQVGRTMRVLVSASNAGGSVTAASAVTAAVSKAAAPTPAGRPGLTEMPVIHGAAMERQILTATTGKWNNAPSVYSYQWKRCDGSGNKCVNIVGATTRTYKLTALDIGHTVRVMVTASNSGGSTDATSAASPVVKRYVSPTRRTKVGLTMQLRRIAADQLSISGTAQPRHDRKMLLIQRRTPNGWETVAKVRLRMQNRVRSQYSTTLHNLKPGAYRVYLAGDKAHVPSASNTRMVRGRARVTLQLHQLANHRVRLSGIVAPRHDGKTVLIQLRAGSGWKTIARTELHAQTNDRSRYTVTLPNAKGGVYRVYLAGDAAHIPEASNQVTVR